jgi:hypothetical protein
LNGTTVAQSIQGQDISVHEVDSMQGDIDYLEVGTLVVGVSGRHATWKSQTVVTSVGLSLTAFKYFKTSDDSLVYGNLVNGYNPSSTTIYYLGNS